MRLIRCDKCMKTADASEIEGLEGWSAVRENSMHNEQCMYVHLCPECSKAYKELVKDWLKGGQCITLVNADGSVTTLPMPSVPKGTMRLDSFTEAKAEGEITIGERHE